MNLDLDAPLRKGQLVAVVDFETTGTNPRTAEIVSAAVVHHRLFTNMEPTIVYKTLFRCRVPIPPDATALHGITDEACARRGRDADKAIGGLLPWLNDALLCSYNLPYDWILLDKAIRRDLPGRKVPAFGHIDPCVWNRVVWPGRSSSLTAVSEAHGFRFGELAHNAEHDARATARVIDPLLRRVLVMEMKRKDLPTPNELWAWTRNRAAGFERGGDLYRACEGEG